MQKLRQFTYVGKASLALLLRAEDAGDGVRVPFLRNRALTPLSLVAYSPVPSSESRKIVSL